MPNGINSDFRGLSPQEQKLINKWARKHDAFKRRGQFLSTLLKSTVCFRTSGNFTTCVLLSPSAKSIRIGVCKRNPTDAENERNAHGLALQRACLSDIVRL